MLCLIHSTDYYIIVSIYLILGQYAKPLCQVVTEHLILCTRIGTQNKCPPNIGCIFLQPMYVLSLFDGDSRLLRFAQFTLKCGDEALGTASTLAIFVRTNRIYFDTVRIPMYKQEQNCTSRRQNAHTPWAHVTPGVMYGGISSTDFTFCRCTVFVGFLRRISLIYIAVEIFLMAYDSALVIALYAVTI